MCSRTTVKNIFRNFLNLFCSRNVLKMFLYIIGTVSELSLVPQMSGIILENTSGTIPEHKF